MNMQNHKSYQHMVKFIMNLIVQWLVSSAATVKFVQDNKLHGHCSIITWL